MPIPPLLLGLAGLQGIEGLANVFAGKSDLERLHAQKFPEYAETPEQQKARLRADAMSAHGYTPEEVAARDQKLIRSENTGFQKGMNVAPNQAQALLSAANYTNAGAQNQFASNDAALHRQNIAYADKLTQQQQNLSNMNIAAQQRNRLAAEQALGQGIANSRDRAFGAANTLIAGSVFGQMNPTGTGNKIASTSQNGIPLNPNNPPSRYALPYQQPATTDWSGAGGYNIPALAGVGKLFGAPAQNTGAYNYQPTDWLNTGGY